jgi:hypothetical protein
MVSDKRNVGAVDRRRRGMFTARTTSSKAGVMRVAVVVLALLTLSLGGCAVISVVDTAVSATATVVGTTVDVAAGAVGAVAGSSDDEDIDCDDEDNKDEDVCKEKAKKKAEAKPES